MNGNSDPQPRGEEAKRRRRERRNKDFKGLKLFPVLIRVGDKKRRFWRVTKPRVGGGRTVKTYASRDEAETVFDIAYTQAKNYGVGSGSNLAARMANRCVSDSLTTDDR